MPNDYIKNHLKNKIHAALMEIDAVGAIGHQGLKGKIREILTTRIFEDILLDGISIGYGKIQDRFGNESSESDIILYCSKLIAPILYGEKTGVFPIESVLVVIEVKSILNAEGLKDTIKKSEQLNSLDMGFTRYPLNPMREGHHPIRSGPTFVLFAYKSDLSGNGIDEIERYKRYDQNAFTEPALQVICIPQKGYWWFAGNSWKKIKPTSDYQEVINFIGHMVNTLPEAILNRGLPVFGYYIND